MVSQIIAKTDSGKARVSHAVSGIDRRSFIRLLATNSALLAAAKPSAGHLTIYVGVGYSSDPYTAASVALSACGQFPINLAGRTVVIKPNLVVPKPSTSGATTDPLVAQAIVDLCIAAGATACTGDLFGPRRGLGRRTADQPNCQLCGGQDYGHPLNRMPRGSHLRSSPPWPSKRSNIVCRCAQTGNRQVRSV